MRQCEKGVRLFDMTAPTGLATDWSKSCMGFWLMQKHCACPGACLPSLSLHLVQSLAPPSQMMAPSMVPCHYLTYPSKPDPLTPSCYMFTPATPDLMDLLPSSSPLHPLVFPTTTPSGDWKRNPGDRFSPPESCTPTWPL